MTGQGVTGPADWSKSNKRHRKEKKVLKKIDNQGRKRNRAREKVNGERCHHAGFVTQWRKGVGEKEIMGRGGKGIKNSGGS